MLVHACVGWYSSESSHLCTHCTIENRHRDATAIELQHGASQGEALYHDTSSDRASEAGVRLDSTQGPSVYHRSRPTCSAPNHYQSRCARYRSSSSSSSSFEPTLTLQCKCYRNTQGNRVPLATSRSSYHRTRDTNDRGARCS